MLYKYTPMRIIADKINEQEKGGEEQRFNTGT